MVAGNGVTHSERTPPDEYPTVQPFILTEDLVGPTRFVDKFRKGSLQGGNHLLICLGNLIRIDRYGTIQLLCLEGQQAQQPDPKGKSVISEGVCVSHAGYPGLPRPWFLIQTE